MQQSYYPVHEGEEPPSPTLGDLFIKARNESQNTGRLGEAFAKFYNAYSGPIKSYAMFLTGDEHLAEDLTQEASLTLCKNINNIREPQAIIVWLKKVARNTFISSLQKKSVATSSMGSEITSTFDPYGLIHRIDLDSALDRLGSEEKNALIRHHVQGEKVNEMIANDSRRPHASTQKRELVHGRNNMQKILGDDYLHIH